MTERPPIIGTALETVGNRQRIQVCTGTYQGDIRDPDFRFNLMFVELQGPIPLHGHEYAELALVLGGKGIHQIDDEEAPISAGDIFVMTGNHRHGFREVEGLRLCNLQFDPDQFLAPEKELTRMMGFHALFELEPRSPQREAFRQRLRLGATELAYVEALARSIEAEFQGAEEGRATLIRSTFLTLVTHLSRLYAAQKQHSPAPVVRMASVIAHMRKRFHEPLRIEQLAAIAQLSASQFQRRFKKLYQLTPIEFIIKLRVEQACALLRDPNRAVGEISRATGFSTPAFFSTQFRKSTGHSPSEYRRKVLATSAQERFLLAS
jgi:AraC-like DNA-binding protein/quercetin dioxygenase-like cupin family protein